jgi:phospholipid transport system substrate-binding protein
MNRGFLRSIFLSVGILLTLLSLTPALSLAASSGEPVSVVNKFHNALLATMKSAATDGVKSRFNALSPAVKESFHSAKMIQVASGAFWRKASDQQKASLTDAFSRYSTSTYAAQFNGYSGQSFETIGHKPGPQNTVLVETQIVDPGSRTVPLTYVTRQNEGRWLIVDVLLDTGISQLATKRSEYRKVLKNKGIDGLVRMLNAKTKSLLQD